MEVSPRATTIARHSWLREDMTGPPLGDRQSPNDTGDRSGGASPGSEVLSDEVWMRWLLGLL